MNDHSWPVDRRAELARREVDRRAQVERVELDARPRGDDTPGGWAVLPARIACDPSLTPEARLVLLILSAHSDDRTHPYPSVARIARMLGRSERTVLRLLAELEGRELIRRLHRYRNGEQTSSAYQLCFDRWAGTRKDAVGVSPVTGRGDTHDTPRGDTGGTPRGDTGGVQTMTRGPLPPEQVENPPSPPAHAGGDTSPAPLEGESRGDRVARLRRSQGWTLRRANAEIDTWDAWHGPAAVAAREQREAEQREQREELERLRLQLIADGVC